MSADDPKRPRGRPRIEEPRLPVSTRLHSTQHDALIAIAKRRDVSVSALVQDIIAKAVTPRAVQK